MGGLEVPVQVSGLLLLAFIVYMEASSTLIAWLSKFLVEAEDEMGSGSNKTLAENRQRYGILLTTLRTQASE